MEKDFVIHEINVRKTKILPDNYVGITEECIVQFLPGQPMRAVCMGLQIDVLGRFFYDLELILTNDNGQEIESTYIYNVNPSYVFSVNAIK